MSIIARQQYDERPVLSSDLDFSNDPGLTKQSDSRDCDINAIFKRFEKTGQLPDMIVREPHYGDFSSVPDFRESLEIVRMAEAQFAALDVNIRNQFSNDPAQFLEFVNNPGNIDKLEEMGLLKPEVVEKRRQERLKADEGRNAEESAKREADERRLIDKIKAELQK